MLNIKLLVLIMFCVVSPLIMSAQDTEPSPWSRFGLGLPAHILSSPQLMMGGVSAPILDGHTINPSQPASAAGAITTMFQSTIQGTRTNMTEGDSSAIVQSGTPGAISLVLKRTGGSSAMMIGMMPYSAKGFNVSRTFENEIIGEVREEYTGNGGTARSYLGVAHAFRGKKWLSAGEVDSVLVSNRSLFLGGQVSYLFGEAVQTGRLDIADVTYLDNRTRTTLRHRSLGGLFGIQAFQLLWAKYDKGSNFLGSATLHAGATYAPASNLYTDYFKIVETVQLLSNVETVLDTSFYISAIDSKGRLPSKWTAGAALVFEGEKGNRFLIAADHMREDWTSIAGDFEINILEGDATWSKASRSSIGLSYKPKNSGGANNALSRSTFKAGFGLDAYPISYKGYQLKGWRASAGITIPLEGSRSTSRFHLGMEMGHRGIERGTVLGETLEESLLNIQIGVTLTPFFKNLWLTPKLYD